MPCASRGSLAVLCTGGVERSAFRSFGPLSSCQIRELVNFCGAFLPVKILLSGVKKPCDFFTHT